jgi:hypothetical protein
MCNGCPFLLSLAFAFLSPYDDFDELIVFFVFVVVVVSSVVLLHHRFTRSAGIRFLEIDPFEQYRSCTSLQPPQNCSLFSTESGRTG